MQSVHGFTRDISVMFLAHVCDLVFCILGAIYVHSPKFPWQSVSVPLLVITLCNLIFALYQIIQVHDLLKLYYEINVPPERLLFKIPSTWQVSI
jgi:hypothetical protein